MISNVLRAIGGIGVYDAVSIVLFVLVFAGAVVFACRLKKPFLNTMSLMPLNDQEGETRHD